ncbi:MAG: GNAT family N-acetyltransferase, partial [Desulfomonilaceae bacterium]
MDEDNATTLALGNDPRLLGAVVNFIGNVSEVKGFSAQEAFEIGKLAKDILEYLFTIDGSPREAKNLKVSIFVEEDEFFVSLEHKGLPIELKGDNSIDVSPFSLSISSPAVDKVKLINRGKEGQSLQLVKRLPTGRSDHQLVLDSPLKLSRANPDTLVDRDIEIRMIQPDEGLKLARCFYRVYGYTYGLGYVYSPDLLNVLIGSRRLFSAVAVDKSGEIVAHGAMKLSKPEDRVGELISLAVDPEFRGMGLATRIHLHLMDYAKKIGLMGVFGEAVTIHPFSQRLCSALGGKETAIMLGYIPPANYKRIASDSHKRRQLAIVYFFPLDLADGSNPVFAPLR